MKALCRLLEFFPPLKSRIILCQSLFILIINGAPENIPLAPSSVQLFKFVLMLLHRLNQIPVFDQRFDIRDGRFADARIGSDDL